MKITMIIIRSLIAVFVGPPTIWILYLIFTLFGVGLIIPFYGFFGLIGNVLIEDKNGIEESVNSLKLGGEMLIMPFVFWWLFIIGKNPFTELGI